MDDLTISNEIKRQLGDKALAMLGAHQFVGGENELRFRIEGCHYINCIVIELNPLDLYDIEFWNLGAVDKPWEIAMVDKLTGMYLDELHNAIESVTGLTTRI